MKKNDAIFLNRVDEILRQRGFVPKQNQQSVPFDLAYQKQDDRFVIEANVVSIYRSREFRALIGDAILRFQASNLEKSVRLMLVVEFRRMGRDAEADLKEYADKFLPSLCWILASRDGDIRLHLAPDINELIQAERPRRVSSVPARAVSSRALFSPKSQWLWKSILLPGIDPRYWFGPNHSPRSSAELIQCSDVSQSVVSSFVSRAEDAGFLSRERDTFTVLNHRELLDDWVHALKHSRRQVVDVRPLYGDVPEAELLANLRNYCRKTTKVSENPPVIVGSHLACHLLGLGRSNQRSAKLYIGAVPIEEVMAALELVPVTNGEGLLSIEVDGISDSIGRGCVMVDGVPVVDALQCFLDVRPSPARGREQADFIYEHILQPHFARR